MHHVYLLRSIPWPRHKYVGVTNNVKRRLQEHNRGVCPHTKKNKPWELIAFVAFKDKQKAIEFESYLKTSSGRSFSSHHFW